MERKHFGTYTGIRKVKWDEMWHVMFEYEQRGKIVESWDRVTKAKAMAILKKIK